MNLRTLTLVTSGLLAASTVLACQAEVEPAKNTTNAGGSAGTSAQGGSAGSSAGAPNTGGAISSGGSTAGTTSAGGSSGSAGASGGSAGSGGDSAGSGGGAGAPTSSAGCNMPAGQQLEEWVERGFNIDGVDRQAWVYLPANYDPTRAYPVVFLFHGCTGITNNVPMWNVTGEDAILMRGAGTASNICWANNSADVDFFDAMVESIETSHCVDTSRIFGVGYSSGSWLLNRLECVRGDVLRAVGTVAGGGTNQPNSCVDTVARVFVPDLNDEETLDDGNFAERDRLLTVNGCDEGAEPVMEDPAPCARYPGCDPANPVIWCGTSGEGHGRQDQFASQVFWQLFSSL